MKLKNPVIDWSLKIHISTVKYSVIIARNISQSAQPGFVIIYCEGKQTV